MTVVLQMYNHRVLQMHNHRVSQMHNHNEGSFPIVVVRQLSLGLP